MAITKREKFADEIKRLKEQKKRIAEKAGEATERTVGTAVTIGGGALGGYIDGEKPDWEIMGLNANTMVGAGVTVVGLMGWAGKQWSDMMMNLGEGMLAYEAGKRVRESR